MVARLEHISHEAGLIVASEEGLQTHPFATAIAAVAWLDAATEAGLFFQAVADALDTRITDDKIG